MLFGTTLGGSDELLHGVKTKHKHERCRWP
jgi:hypothetical protein